MAELKGKSCTLKVDISGTYTALGQITGFTPPEKKFDEQRPSYIGGTGKGCLATMFAWGDVKASIVYDPDSQTHGLLDDAITGADKNWKIEYSDATATVWSWAGPVLAFTPGEIEPSGLVTAEVTIGVNGDITVT